MSYETIRELLNRRPFEPFEVWSSAGQIHRISHPETAVLTKNRLVVVDPQTDHIVIVSLLHIAEVHFPQAA